MAGRGSGPDAPEPDAVEPGEPEPEPETRFRALNESIAKLVSGPGLRSAADLPVMQLSEKLSSSELLQRAMHQAELPGIDVSRWTDPTDMRLDDVNEQLAQLIELERRAMDRAELEAQLGVKQDQYTRRIANAGLVLAVVATVFGAIGVVVDIVAVVTRG